MDVQSNTYTGPVFGVGTIEVTKESDTAKARSKMVVATLKRADEEREANAKAAEAERTRRFEEAKVQAKATAERIEQQQAAGEVTPEEAPETFRVKVGVSKD